jgi:hypothetical protein
MGSTTTRTWYVGDMTRSIFHPRAFVITKEVFLYGNGRELKWYNRIRLKISETVRKWLKAPKNCSNTEHVGFPRVDCSTTRFWKYRLWVSHTCKRRATRSNFQRSCLSVYLTLLQPLWYNLQSKASFVFVLISHSIIILFEYWGVESILGPLGTAPLLAYCTCSGWLWGWRIDGINGFGRENQSTQRKPGPTPLCPPEIPLQTRAAAVGASD